MKFIFENKKKYFQIIFLISAALHSIFPLLFYSIKLICISISIIVCLNKKIILINKFSKHNWINILVCEKILKDKISTRLFD